MTEVPQINQMNTKLINIVLYLIYAQIFFRKKIIRFKKIKFIIYIIKNKKISKCFLELARNK